MAPRHGYLLGSFLSFVTFAALLLVANNFYWGASQTPGGDYYLFHRPLPHPLGPLLWACVKPLLFLTPLLTAWLVYRAARAYRLPRAPGVCPACGYDLRATPGRCPECGHVPATRGAKKETTADT